MNILLPRRLVCLLRLGLLLALLGFGPDIGAEEFDPQHAAFSALLGEHVSDGLVDYRALKQSPDALRDYLRQLETLPEATFKTWSEAEQLAFLINLYNAVTLQLIIEHYPLDSIKDIGNWAKGPWDQPVVPLFEKRLTLNHLEHRLIRKQYKEPRIHMALVCAARGCPPLKATAYVGTELDAQLAEQSRGYLASPQGLRLDSPHQQVYLSAIFNWYGKDFASVPAFVESHTPHRIAGLKIRYLDYDWSLNDKAGATDE